MRRQLLAVLAFAVTVFLACGCGTVMNTLWLNPEVGGMRVYGGVRIDAEVGYHAIVSPETTDSVLDRVRHVLQPTLDLPFSLLGDTVTLPLTIYHALQQSDVLEPTYPNAFRDGETSQK